MSVLEPSRAFVTRAEDRQKVLWAGKTVFDVILEGGITAWSGSDVTEVDACGAVFLPAGQPHALGIRTDRARLITVTAPGGFASFVRAAGVPASGDVPATWEFDVERIMAVAPQHDISIVGPPPQLPA